MQGKRWPWLYIPSLYFAEGLPYILINAVSVIMFKKMNVSNTVIGLTGFLYLPWVIKMFWGPVVDTVSTKRQWILATQILMAVCFLLVAAGVQVSGFLSISLVLFFITAFLSATHDIAIDGYYMLALDEKKQAFYVGIRSTFYRIAIIFATGALVVIAGTIEKSTGNIAFSWSVVFMISGGIFFLLYFFHRFYLPHPVDNVVSEGSRFGDMKQVFKTYFQQKNIILIVLFVLFYRLGEAILGKMTAPFLLDGVEKGGLGLETTTVGYLYGTVGMLSLVAGGIVGGWLISKFGLKKCIWPMALALKAPDLVYVYMSTVHPSIEIIYPLVAVEQFGYGIGFTAFMVFLMYLTQEKYKTSHFAISTGIMALGMMIPGMISGYLQTLLGYTNFFIMVVFLTLPGLIVLFFLPIPEESK